MEKAPAGNAKKPGIRFMMAGMAALAVVHALGRFSFTPLLPYFVKDGMITVPQGADLATVNYVGYFLGALAAVIGSKPHRIGFYTISALLLNAFITLLQCFTVNLSVLLVLRGANGITNGIVFVLAPAMLLEWLAEHHLSRWSGLVYFGVGLGLLAGGILVDATAPRFHANGRWFPVAVASVILACYSAFWYRKIKIKSLPHTPDGESVALFDRFSTPLFLSYIGAGLGYILPMTFLPALAQVIAAGHPSFLIGKVWIITALSCTVFIPVWNRVGARYGDKQAILLSYIVQAAGVLAVLVLKNMPGVFLCAIMVGGGFLGSVMCTQRLARFFQPAQGPKLSATMITIYAGAQLVGPWIAKIIIKNGGSLLLSFVIGLIAFVWGIVWTLLIPKK